MKPTGIPLEPEELLAQTERIRGLVRQLVLDEATADDVVQDTVAVALQRPPRHQENPGGWLRTVAKNLAFKHRRGTTRRAAREAAVARPEAQPSTLDVVAALEWQQRLNGALMALDEPYRATVVNRHLRGLDAKTIAQLDGISKGAVNARLRHALASLRRSLNAQQDEPGSWVGAFLPLLVTPDLPAPPPAPSPATPGLGASLMGVGAVAAAVAAAGADPDVPVEGRVTALVWLERLEVGEGLLVEWVQPILAAPEEHPGSVVRAAALLTALRAPPWALSALLDALLQTPRREDWSELARSLALLGDVHAVPTLVAVCAAAPTPVARDRVARNGLAPLLGVAYRRDAEPTWWRATCESRPGALPIPDVAPRAAQDPVPEKENGR